MQGFNMGRYRPPDADPQREPFNGQRHPLGKRAHKLASEGILVVRFELPFPIWCNSCQGLLVQGTRYNAEKRRVGNYHSTPLWAFRAKCRHCSAYFEIQTDPKNTRYIVTEGAKQKVEEWDPEDEGNGAAIVDLTSGGGISSSTGTDAFSQLEKETNEKTLNERRTKRILELEAHASSRWSDPYVLNAKMRKTFRGVKKIEQAKRIEEDRFRKSIGWKDDAAVAPLQDGESTKTDDQKEWKRLRDERDREQAHKGSLPGRNAATTTTPSSQRKARSSTSITSARIAKMTPTGQELASKILGRK